MGISSAMMADRRGTIRSSGMASNVHSPPSGVS
ncbi:Uncharacterised protein [Bordetella pertussis]|nr:Uncharacterised protein [Bordetella pertussis]